MNPIQRPSDQSMDAQPQQAAQARRDLSHIIQAAVLALTVEAALGSQKQGPSHRMCGCHVARSILAIRPHLSLDLDHHTSHSHARKDRRTQQQRTSSMAPSCGRRWQGPLATLSAALLLAALVLAQAQPSGSGFEPPVSRDKAPEEKTNPKVVAPVEEPAVVPPSQQPALASKPPANASSDSPPKGGAAGAAAPPKEGAAAAEGASPLKLANTLGSHMVLQREPLPACLYGTGTPFANVQVRNRAESFQHSCRSIFLGSARNTLTSSQWYRWASTENQRRRRRRRWIQWASGWPACPRRRPAGRTRWVRRWMGGCALVLPAPPKSPSSDNTTPADHGGRQRREANAGGRAFRGGLALRRPGARTCGCFNFHFSPGSSPCRRRHRRLTFSPHSRTHAVQHADVDEPGLQRHGRDPGSCLPEGPARTYLLPPPVLAPTPLPAPLSRSPGSAHAPLGSPTSPQQVRVMALALNTSWEPLDDVSETLLPWSVATPEVSPE